MFYIFGRFRTAILFGYLWMSAIDSLCNRLLLSLVCLVPSRNLESILLAESLVGGYIDFCESDWRIGVWLNKICRKTRDSSFYNRHNQLWNFTIYFTILSCKNNKQFIYKLLHFLNNFSKCTYEFSLSLFVFIICWESLNFSS